MKQHRDVCVWGNHSGKGANWKKIENRVGWKWAVFRNFLLHFTNFFYVLHYCFFKLFPMQNFRNETFCKIANGCQKNQFLDNFCCVLQKVGKEDTESLKELSRIQNFQKTAIFTKKWTVCTAPVENHLWTFVFLVDLKFIVLKFSLIFHEFFSLFIDICPQFYLRTLVDIFSVAKKKILILGRAKPYALTTIAHPKTSTLITLRIA